MNNLQMLHKINMAVNLVQNNVDNLASKDDIKALCACLKNIVNILGECPFIDHKTKFNSIDAFSTEELSKSFKKDLSIATQVHYEGDDAINGVFEDDN